MENEAVDSYRDFPAARKRRPLQPLVRQRADTTGLNRNAKYSLSRPEGGLPFIDCVYPTGGSGGRDRDASTPFQSCRVDTSRCPWRQR